MKHLLTRYRRVALLSTVCFLVSVSYMQEAFAQVDARRELLKVQAQYAQYLQEEQDYTARTQEHMNSAIETLLNTWGTAALKRNLKEDGVAAARITEDLYSLKKNVAAGLEGDNREQAYLLLNQIADKIVDQIAKAMPDVPFIGQIPGMVDTVFHLLYMREDIQQREMLDAQREDLDKLQRYWSDYAAGHPWQSPPTPNMPPMSSRDVEFQRAISRLGIELTAPNQAIKEGKAQITASAAQGYSVTEINIVNASNKWLALNFNGTYLIPLNASSHSQRLGLISSIDEPVSRASQNAAGSYDARFRLVQLPGSSIPSGRRSLANKHWVLIAPKIADKVLFHSVCLDHSLGTPGYGEPFYVSDQPLPRRVRSILLRASLHNMVPQGYVWEVIQEEHIRWWDPRFGPEAMLAEARRKFEAAQFDSAAEIASDVLTQDPHNGTAARIAGESYYRLALSSFDSQHAIQLYSASQQKMMQALAEGQSVTIPVMHHHTSGLDQDLCSGQIIISRSIFGFHSAQQPEHSFEIPIEKIYEIKLEAEKAGRLHTKIGLQKGKKESKQTFNFQSAEVKLRRETVMIGTSPFSSNSIVCTLACGPSIEVVYQVLMKTRGLQ